MITDDKNTVLGSTPKPYREQYKNKPYWEQYEKERGRLSTAFLFRFILYLASKFVPIVGVLTLAVTLAVLIFFLRTLRAEFLWWKHEYKGPADARSRTILFVFFPQTTWYDKARKIVWIACMLLMIGLFISL